MKKKLLSLCLAAMMALALTACGGTDEPQQTATEPNASAPVQTGELPSDVQAIVERGHPAGGREV